jgi:hypothetical protein
MNGFAEHGLDDGAFGEKTGNIVKAFDAFREFYSSLTSARCGDRRKTGIGGAIILFLTSFTILS